MITLSTILLLAALPLEGTLTCEEGRATVQVFEPGRASGPLEEETLMTIKSPKGPLYPKGMEIILHTRGGRGAYTFDPLTWMHVKTHGLTVTVTTVQGMFHRFPGEIPECPRP